MIIPNWTGNYLSAFVILFAQALHIKVALVRRKEFETFLRAGISPIQAFKLLIIQVV
jgi:hypothetical protein